MINRFFLFLCLLLFFLLLRDDWSLTSIFMGSFFSAILVWIKAKIFPDNINDKNFSYYKLSLYLVWLMKEIFTASFRIAKLLIFRKFVISPGYQEINHGLADQVSTTIYAMSITLTPGTYVVKSTDRLLIHSLWQDEIKNLAEGNSMQQKIKNL